MLHAVLYLKLRSGLILTAHTHYPWQMYFWCAADVVVVIVVFRCAPCNCRLCCHLVLWPVFVPRDCDLLYWSGDSRGRGNVLVQLVLCCHPVLVVFHGGYLLDNRRDETGAMCTHLWSTEVERVQIVLQHTVIQSLAGQITLCKILTFCHSRSWQPCPNGKGLHLPHNALRHD